MLDISAVLDEIKALPFNEVIVRAPHCGVVSFAEGLQQSSCLYGPSGEYKEKSGTIIATIDRENNPQPITSPEKGELVKVHNELDGVFVEAGTELIRLRHFLTKEEVVQIILRKALHLFVAPERAKYYFVPSVDTKIKVSGPKSISVRDGEELFIQSRMKRETSLRYSGPEGIVYSVYFTYNENVDAGEPLIGVCPPGLVEQVESVVLRVQTEWRELG